MVRMLGYNFIDLNMFPLRTPHIDTNPWWYEIGTDTLHSCISVNTIYSRQCYFICENDKESSEHNTLTYDIISSDSRFYQPF